MLDDKTLLDQEPEENQSEIPLTGDVATPSDIAETTFNEPADDTKEPSASSVIDAVLDSNDVDITDQSAAVKHTDIVKPTISDANITEDKSKRSNSTSEPIAQTVIQSNSNTTTEIRTTSTTENRIESHPSTIINLTVNQANTENKEEARVTQTTPVIPTKVNESTTVDQSNKTVEQKAPEKTAVSNQPVDPTKSIVNQTDQNQTTVNTTTISPAESAIQDEVNSMDIFNLFGLNEPIIQNPDSKISPSESALAAATTGDVNKKIDESGKVKSTEPATPSATVDPLTGIPTVISPEEDALREIFTALTDPNASWLTGYKPADIIENAKAPTSPGLIALESVKPAGISKSTDETVDTKQNIPAIISTDQSTGLTPSAITKSVNQPVEQTKLTEPIINNPGINTPTDIITATVNSNSSNKTTDQLDNAGRVETNKPTSEATTNQKEDSKSSDNSKTGIKSDVSLIEPPEIRVDHKSNALTPATIKNILTSTETKGLTAVNDSLAGVKLSLDAVKEATINTSNTTNSTSNSTMLVNNVEAAKLAQEKAAVVPEVKKEEPPVIDTNSGLTEFYLHAIYDALVSQGIKIKSYG